jgi:hypothetical protein
MQVTASTSELSGVAQVGRSPASGRGGPAMSRDLHDWQAWAIALAALVVLGLVGAIAR